MPKLSEDDYIFDGFCHRRFNPNIDGWRNELPDPQHYPSVLYAKDVLAMFEELKESRRRIWELEKRLSMHDND